jgi:cytochrome c
MSPRRTQVSPIMPTPPLRLLGAVAIACALGMPGAHAADPKALLEQYRCTICHADRQPQAGPSWLDIANRYRNEKQADAVLTAKIRAGARGGGLWHMPPHPEVNKRDAETIAAWILTFRS